jgi:hypothetical protein
LLARLERLELERLFEREFDGLLRRVVRDVLRDAVRRFVPVLRPAVDLRALDLRDVDFRPAVLRVVLRDEVLRAVALRPVLLRVDVLRADVLRADDDLRRDDLRVAAVLPEPSRRFVFARSRLFSDGLSWLEAPASCKAIAIACFGFLTLPRRPLPALSSPCLYSCMTRSTVFFCPELCLAMNLAPLLFTPAAQRMNSCIGS